MNDLWKYFFKGDERNGVWKFMELKYRNIYLRVAVFPQDCVNQSNSPLLASFYSNSTLGFYKPSFMFIKTDKNLIYQIVAPFLHSHMDEKVWDCVSDL